MDTLRHPRIRRDRASPSPSPGPGGGDVGRPRVEGLGGPGLASARAGGREPATEVPKPGEGDAGCDLREANTFLGLYEVKRT